MHESKEATPPHYEPDHSEMAATTLILEQTARPKSLDILSVEYISDKLSLSGSIGDRKLFLKHQALESYGLEVFSTIAAE